MQARSANDCGCLFDPEGMPLGSVHFRYGDIPALFSDEAITIANGGSVLSHSASSGWDIGVTATVGYGIQYWNTNLSAGGNYNHARSWGGTDRMLMDLNGDGLPDIVLADERGIRYRPQKLLPDGTYAFGEEEDTGLPFNRLSRETGKTNTWGAQAGAEYMKHHTQVNASFSAGWSNTDTYTTHYFADVNGDGLPDYVADGLVWFNRIGLDGGFLQPTADIAITPDSTRCTSNFLYDGEAKLPSDCYQDTVILAAVSLPASLETEPAGGMGNMEDTLTCTHCKEVCRRFLLDGDRTQRENCLECSHLSCDLNVECTACDYNCEPWNEDCERMKVLCRAEHSCPESICMSCLEAYADEGPYSQSYRQCADTACWFKGTEVCDDCREICRLYPSRCRRCVRHVCEDPCEWYGCVDTACDEHPQQCDDCLQSPVSALCDLPKKCRDICQEGMATGDMSECESCVRERSVCSDCRERCGEDGDPYDCNECKKENGCNGVIDDNVLYSGHCNQLETVHDTCDCVYALWQEDAICDECRYTCLYHPEQCINCMNRLCSYRTVQWVQDSLGADLLQRMRLRYPDARVMRRNGQAFAYITEIVCPDGSQEPDLEAVRVWVAPRDGEVTLTTSVRLLEDTTAARRRSRTTDGVRCVIQHNRHVTPAAGSTGRLHAAASSVVDAWNLPATDYQTHVRSYGSINVEAGDVFFFRLRSRGSRSYDNTEWTQTFTYADGSTPAVYASARDFTVSDSRMFQPDTAHTVTAALRVTVSDGQQAVLKLMKGTQAVRTVQLTADTVFTVTLPDCPADTALRALLSPASPQNNLGSVEVGCRFSYPYSHAGYVDTVSLWLVPGLVFTPEVQLDTAFHELFGSLYRGWGQFGYNSTADADLITLDSLCNIALHLSVTDSAGFMERLEALAEDTLVLTNRESLESRLAGHGLYSPLGGAWVPLTADAQAWCYELYGNTGRMGRRLHANTPAEQSALRQLGTNYADAAEATAGGIYDCDNTVPKATGGITPKAIPKKSHTRQRSISFGGNVNIAIKKDTTQIPEAGAGYSHSSTDYSVEADFLDLNGDRYPDIVYPASVQYTMPWGGLGDKVNVQGSICNTQSEANGTSFSGGYTKIAKLPDGRPRNGRFSSSQAGTGGSRTKSSMETVLSYTDLNGDGLPDRITREGDSVYAALNIGYGFTERRSVQGLLHFDESNTVCWNGNVNTDPESVGTLARQLLHITGDTARNTISGKFQMSLSLGCSTSKSTNSTQTRLIDLNGDGLPDLVTMGSDGQMRVRFHRHGAFDGLSVTDSTGRIQESTTRNISLEPSVTAGFPVWLLKVCLGVSGSPMSLSDTEGTYDLTDMDGDGLPDLVWADSGGIHYRRNQSGKRDLLTAVVNPTGQTFSLGYTLSAPSAEQPCRQWQLSEVRDLDLHADTTGCRLMARRIAYSGPHYDRAERTPLGCAADTVSDLNTALNETAAYRHRIRRYQNQAFLDASRLIYEAVTDSAGRLFTEYELGTVYVDRQGNETADLCRDATIRTGRETHFMRYYEGGTEPIVTARQYDYDRYHNVTAYRNLGDTAVHDDDLSAVITYKDASSGAASVRNLISLPVEVLVSGNGQTMRATRATYNDRGQLTQLRQLAHPAQTTPTDSAAAEGGVSADDAVTDYAYDTLGMLASVTLPQNGAGQRARLEVSYDPLTHSLPAMVTDQWNRRSLTRWHPAFQRPLCIKDVAGDSINYKYDSHGRLTDIFAPDTGSTRTHIYYEYGPQLFGQGYISWNPARNRRPYVYTYIYTSWDDNTFDYSDYLFEEHLCDVRGRHLQTAKDRAGRLLVTDRTATDCFGRATTTYRNTLLPPTATWGNTRPLLYTDSLSPVASMTYDVLDRPLRTSWADGVYSTDRYTIGEDAFGVRRLLTIHTDENGNEWQTFRSPQEWVTTSVTPDGHTTTFTCDPLGQLLESTDPDGLTTRHVYDAFGRRTERTHPDAGTTRWHYDPAGNLTASQTQRQIDAGCQTTCDYDYDRLTAVHYPQHAEADVTYEYDGLTGRLIQRTDATGWERYEYDGMGNVSQTDRLMVVPTESNAYRFLARFAYDGLGRILRITYPDGEEVTYRYSDGLLRSVTGTNTASPNASDTQVSYIDSIRYDEYDRPVKTCYGNGTAETAEYHPIRQWLTRKTVFGTRDTVIHTGEPYTPDTLLQDIRYDHDGVGNIVHVGQTVSKRFGLGGAYTADYFYDAENRLTDAQQYSTDLGDYTYNMTYSPAGRVGTRSCPEYGMEIASGYKTDPEAGTVTNHRIGGVADYVSGSPLYMEWDRDGQLTDMFRPCEGDPAVRHQVWDEAGRLALVMDAGGTCGYYGYDADGNRAYKLTGTASARQWNGGYTSAELFLDDAVLYVNPYMVVTPRGYTKHYYNGNQRIAAQTGCLSLNSHEVEADSALLRSRTLMKSLLGCNGEQGEEDREAEYSEKAAEYESAEYWDINGDILPDLYPPCERPSLLYVDNADYSPDMLYGAMHYMDETYGSNAVFHCHSDHLGSATWITDKSGHAVQYLHYLPYGELWENQKTVGYNERFTFTGKERDEETGYTYHGARYYSPMAYIGWLSPDPLLDDYPGITPYAYCAWNPMGFVDEDGRELKILGSNVDESYNQLQNTIGNGKRSLHLSINTDGVVTCTLSPGTKKLNAYSQRLMEVINDKGISVEIHTTNQTDFDIGAFCGNQIQSDGSITARQKYNPDMADNVKMINSEGRKVDYENSGIFILHEITEGYEGGKISQSTGEEAKPTREGQPNKIYQEAHKRAVQHPKIKKGVGSYDNITIELLK